MNKLKIIGAIVGLVAAFVVFRNVEFHAVLRAIMGAGPGLVWVLVNSFAWYLLYTRAWQSYFANLTHNIPFLHLLKIKFCGESVNLITPMSFMLGDPVRIYMLSRYVGRGSRLGSVLVDRLLHVVATTFFVWSGLGLAVFLPGPDLPREVLGVVFGVYSALMMVFIWVLTDLGKGRGLLRILGLIKRFLPAKFREKAIVFTTEIHEDIGRFSGRNMLALAKPFAFHVTGRFLGGVEIAILMYLLLGRFDLMQAVQLAALTSAGHLIFSFVPGGIGVIESLYAYYFSHAGADAETGIGLQLIRRLRAFFWVLFGLVVFLVSKHHDKDQIHS
jgi:uncharacterized protein (TIRG00374 family)